MSGILKKCFDFRRQCKILAFVLVLVMSCNFLCPPPKKVYGFAVVVVLGVTITAEMVVAVINILAMSGIYFATKSEAYEAAMTYIRSMTKEQLEDLADACKGAVRHIENSTTKAKGYLIDKACALGVAGLLKAVNKGGKFKDADGNVVESSFNVTASSVELRNACISFLPAGLSEKFASKITRSGFSSSIGSYGNFALYLYECFNEKRGCLTYYYYTLIYYKDGYAPYYTYDGSWYNFYYDSSKVSYREDSFQVSSYGGDYFANIRYFTGTLDASLDFAGLLNLGDMSLRIAKDSIFTNDGYINDFSTTVADKGLITDVFEGTEAVVVPETFPVETAGTDVIVDPAGYDVVGDVVADFPIGDVDVPSGDVVIPDADIAVPDVPVIGGETAVDGFLGGFWEKLLDVLKWFAGLITGGYTISRVIGLLGSILKALDFTALAEAVEALPATLSNTLVGTGELDFTGFKTTSGALVGVFPFCIPFDLANVFIALRGSPKCPVINIDLSGVKGVPGDFSFEIDISNSDISYIFALLRKLELITFILGLIVVTRNLIRG